MSLIDEIKQYVSSVKAIGSPKLTEKKGLYTLELLVAERKVFLSTKKLQYIAKYRIMDDIKEVKFTELLKESGSGLSSGDSSPGFGFKTETYKTGVGPREGSIDEQSKLFGKDYAYTFNFQTIRSQIEQLTKIAGYAFKYQITSKGL